MRSTILFILASVFLGLCILTSRITVSRIEADISHRVEAIVAPVATVALTVDGRDVTLIGRVRTSAELEPLRQAAESLLRSIGEVRGVRSVSGGIEITPQPAAGSTGHAAVALALAPVPQHCAFGARASSWPT